MLSGECLADLESQERRLRAWDFVHCPAGTEHIFVGAGDGPCVIFMAGARREPRDTVYVRSEARVAPSRRRGARDGFISGGVRPVRAVATRTAVDLGRPAVG